MALSFGSAKESPDSRAVLRAMEFPRQSVIVNLLGAPLADRAGCLASLLPSILELRSEPQTFLQLAEGVDDETWMFDLWNGDYSTWFEAMIKNEELKRQAAEVEKDHTLWPQESRLRIRHAVEARCTAPA